VVWIASFGGVDQSYGLPINRNYLSFMPYILVFIIVFSPLVSHAQTFDNAFANISGLQDFINNLSQKSKNISLSGWIEKFKQGTESPAIKKIIEVLAVLGEIIDISKGCFKYIDFNAKSN